MDCYDYDQVELGAAVPSFSDSLIEFLLLFDSCSALRVVLLGQDLGEIEAAGAH